MKYLIYIAIGALVFLASCTEKIDLKLDSTYTRLIVEGNITDEYKVQSVKLSLTADYFANEKAKPCSGALVSILFKDSILNLSESVINPGTYETQGSYRFSPGLEYKLIIKNANVGGTNQNYEAITQMKQPMMLDSVTAEKFKPTMMEAGQFGLDMKKEYYKINGWGQEPATPGDYYIWDYYINGNLESDTLSESVFTDDAMVNGNYIPGIPIFAVDANIGDTVKIATQSISKEYFDFIMSLMFETRWSSGPMGGPPANVKSNVNNGGVGFFRATAVTYSRVIIK